VLLIKDNKFYSTLLSEELPNRFSSDYFNETTFLYYDEEIEAFIFHGKFPF